MQIAESFWDDSCSIDPEFYIYNIKKVVCSLYIMQWLVILAFYYNSAWGKVHYKVHEYLGQSLRVVHVHSLFKIDFTLIFIYFERSFV